MLQFLGGHSSGLYAGVFVSILSQLLTCDMIYSDLIYTCVYSCHDNNDINVSLEEQKWTQ